MSKEIRSTILEPLTPQNAVLLLADQQEGLFSRLFEPEQTPGHLLGQARSCEFLEGPAVMTTALAASSNGPHLHELTAISAGQQIIDCTLINAWQDPRVREAIRAIRRKKVLIAGTGFDVCALAIAAEGYETYGATVWCG